MLEFLFWAWLSRVNQPVTTFDLSPPQSNFWKNWEIAPTVTKNNTKLSPKWLEAKSLSVVGGNLASGQTILQHNANRPQGIASLSKLMTFLIIWENHDLDEVVTIDPEAVKTIGAQIDLYAYERITVETLLQAILIPSANDAARALAIHHAGSEAEFAQKMTQRAHAMGLQSAQFYNATGLDLLDTDQIPYGNIMSARDVYRLTQILLGIEWFRIAVSQENFFGTSIDQQFAHSKPTTNQLHGTFVGSKGVKTGYTPWAGQCLVHLSQKSNETEILSVVLGSQDRFQETKNIITWIWDQ